MEKRHFFQINLSSKDSSTSRSRDLDAGGYVETRADFGRQFESVAARAKVARGIYSCGLGHIPEYERTTGRCHAADISAHVRGLHLTGSKNQWPLPAARYVVVIRQRITADARRCILLRFSRTGIAKITPTRLEATSRVARAMTRTAPGIDDTRDRSGGEEERENGERREDGRRGEGAARMAALV